MAYRQDRDWADRYTPQIREIIRSLAGLIINIRVATEEEDTRQATDYQIITVDGTSIGCRLRKGLEFFYKYNDVTFRKSRPSGVPTEVEKIKAGNPRWYLYGWVDETDQIACWIFIDMDILRTSGLLENPDTTKTNHDNSSSFIGIRVDTLNKNNCLKKTSSAVDLFLKGRGVQESLSAFSLVCEGP